MRQRTTEGRSPLVEDSGAASVRPDSATCPDLPDDCRGVRLEAEADKFAPHFLLNSLQAVSLLLDTGEEEEARRTVHRLSRLLRRQLESDVAGEEPLGEQLDFVCRYMRIEELRHDGQLELDVQVSSAAERALVPTRMLQPLVENAARHGIGPMPDGGRVEIRAGRYGGRVSIRVRDDGVGLPEGWELEEDAGTGLDALRASLCRLHEGTHSFELENRRDGDGAVARITFPDREG